MRRVGAASSSCNPPPRSGALSRVVAGLFGGYLLAGFCAGLSALVLHDFMAKEQHPLVEVAPGLVFVGVLLESVFFAWRSGCTSDAWRAILLRSSAAAFSTPVFVALAFGKAAFLGQDLGMGAIIFLYLGVLGPVVGMLLRWIGKKIRLSNP